MKVDYFGRLTPKKSFYNCLICLPATTQEDKKTERVGFEPTNSYLLNDFESFAFDLSATSPYLYILYFCCLLYTSDAADD